MLPVTPARAPVGLWHPTLLSSACGCSHESWALAGHDTPTCQPTVCRSFCFYNSPLPLAEVAVFYTRTDGTEALLETPATRTEGGAQHWSGLEWTGQLSLPSITGHMHHTIHKPRIDCLQPGGCLSI